MKAKSPPNERRQWPRLPLAIPVFVRSWLEPDNENDRNGKGNHSPNHKETLEFATALNVSAGGMLLVVRRALPLAAQISLEIPSAPLAALAQSAVRNLRAKVLRSQAGPSYTLIGLKFVQPLIAAIEGTAWNQAAVPDRGERKLIRRKRLVVA